MMDTDLAVIKEAVSKGQDEAITAAVSLARNWADSIERSGTPITAVEAVRTYATIIERQWAKTGAGVAHAAE